MPDENKVAPRSKVTRTVAGKTSIVEWNLSAPAQISKRFNSGKFELPSHVGAIWTLSFIYKKSFVKFELTLESAKKTVTNFSGKITLFREENTFLQFSFNRKSLNVQEQLTFGTDFENLPFQNLQITLELLDCQIEYWRNLPNEMRTEKLRNDQFMEGYNDVVLEAKNGTIPANKLLLGLLSKDFKATFTSGMLEEQEPRVKITDIGVEALQELLRFAYTGQVDDLETHAADLMIVAAKYKIRTLKIICTQFLFDNLGIENAVKLLKLGFLLVDDRVKDTATDFIVENILQIRETSEWTTFMETPAYLLNHVIKVTNQRWHANKRIVQKSCEPEKK